MDRHSRSAFALSAFIKVDGNVMIDNRPALFELYVSNSIPPGSNLDALHQIFGQRDPVRHSGNSPIGADSAARFRPIDDDRERLLFEASILATRDADITVYTRIRSSRQLTEC